MKKQYEEMIEENEVNYFQNLFFQNKKSQISKIEKEINQKLEEENKLLLGNINERERTIEKEVKFEKKN